jgi:hypothetical protein
MSEEGNSFPETIALVLWGTDNLKTEGGPIGQALSLLGALPRFDNYGRLAGATLIPLEELGRPRVDVVMTLSGHLPRSAAAADPPAGRGRLPCRPSRRAARAELRAQACTGLSRGARLRSGDRLAAGLQQRRRGLRRQCELSGRQQQLGRRRRAGRNLHASQVLRLRALRSAGPSGRAAQERALHRAAGLPEPRLGGAG